MYFVVTLALKILIYAKVNCGFSGFASLKLHLFIHSLKCLLSFFVVIRHHLLPLAELSPQWAVRQSTAHRLEIRRALYLMPSNNKMLAIKILIYAKVNCGFSGFASQKLHLFIHSLDIGSIDI